MNNLEKIQKTMKVFQTLTKIVMGFSFVAIAFTLVVGSVSLMADKLPFGELLQGLHYEYVYGTGISKTGNCNSHIGFAGKGCKETGRITDCFRDDRDGTTVI